MSHLDMSTGQVVANAAENERANFIKRTYVHLAGAIAALAFLEFLLIQTGIGEKSILLMNTIGSRMYMGASLVIFMLISSFANKWAHSSISREKQYLGLGIYVVLLALYFLPNIYIAQLYSPGIISYAAIVTVALVAGITFTAFSTKVNFSFLGPYLTVGMFVLFGVFIAGMIFGFSLGLWFLGAGILLFGGYTLYYTSNIIHEYHTEQYVAASLALFSSISFMFIYILQFLGIMGDD